MLRRLTSALISIAFLFTSFVGPQSAYGQSMVLPQPGQMVTTSPAFVPVIMRGMTVHKDDPFRFEFIVDSGAAGQDVDAVRAYGDKLVRYFLASLTVPEKNQWVNLSPYEKDRLLPEELGKTELGRDLLAQDYLLKQVTASLIYPEDRLGAEFWKRVYAKAAELGISDIPVNTFNKVWVVADRADVWVAKKTESEVTAYVVDSHLKVMLESDYLAANEGRGTRDEGREDISKQILRDVVIPELEREVNEGENFASLRQMFHSMILATWYKKSLKEALLSKVYANQGKTDGVEGGIADPETIWGQYVEAYKKGVFNLIKEEADETGELIPRKYFSGGLTDLAMAREVRIPSAGFEQFPVGRAFILDTKVYPAPRKPIDNVFKSNDRYLMRHDTVSGKPDGEYLTKADLEKLAARCDELDLDRVTIAYDARKGADELAFALDIALNKRGIRTRLVEEYDLKFWSNGHKGTAFWIGPHPQGSVHQFVVSVIHQGVVLRGEALKTFANLDQAMVGVEPLKTAALIGPVNPRGDKIESSLGVRLSAMGIGQGEAFKQVIMKGGTANVPTAELARAIARTGAPSDLSDTNKILNILRIFVAVRLVVFQEFEAADRFAIANEAVEQVVINYLLSAHSVDDFQEAIEKAIAVNKAETGGELTHRHEFRNLLIQAVQAFDELREPFLAAMQDVRRERAITSLSKTSQREAKALPEQIYVTEAKLRDLIHMLWTVGGNKDTVFQVVTAEIDGQNLGGLESELLPQGKREDGIALIAALHALIWNMPQVDKPVRGGGVAKAPLIGSLGPGLVGKTRQTILNILKKIPAGMSFSQLDAAKQQQFRAEFERIIVTDPILGGKYAKEFSAMPFMETYAALNAAFAREASAVLEPVTADLAQKGVDEVARLRYDEMAEEMNVLRERLTVVQQDKMVEFYERLNRLHGDAEEAYALMADMVVFRAQVHRLVSEVPKRTVLVVNDDQVVLNSTIGILHSRHKDFEFVVARNAGEAYRQILDASPSLWGAIVTDPDDASKIFNTLAALPYARSLQIYAVSNGINGRSEAFKEEVIKQSRTGRLNIAVADADDFAGQLIKLQFDDAQASTAALLDDIQTVTGRMEGRIHLLFEPGDELPQELEAFEFARNPANRNVMQQKEVDYLFDLLQELLVLDLQLEHMLAEASGQKVVVKLLTGMRGRINPSLNTGFREGAAFGDQAMANERPVMLVVEDEPDLRELVAITAQIKFPHMDVVTAATGEEAFAKIQELGPRLKAAALDHDYGKGLNGRDVLAAINGLPNAADVNVVMMTGRDAEERAVTMKQVADNLKSLRVLAKPVIPMKALEGLDAAMKRDPNLKYEIDAIMARLAQDGRLQQPDPLLGTREQPFARRKPSVVLLLIQAQMDFRSRPKTDKAMHGGIDFDAGKMTLNESGAVVDFTFDQSMLEDLQNGNFTGLTPVIIQIVPLPGIAPMVEVDSSTSGQIPA